MKIHENVLAVIVTVAIIAGLYAFIAVVRWANR